MKKIVRELYHFLTLKLLFPAYYRLWARKKINDGKAVFIEANLPELSNSLRYLHARMEAEKTYDLRVHCLKEIQAGRLAYIKNALACLADMADAKYIFLCEGSRLVSCIRPRRQTKIVQVWHGCGAFKKFGFSTSELLFGGSRRDNLRYSYYKNYDLVTVSSPEVVWAYKEAMNLPGDCAAVQPLGISRTDVFFDEAFLQDARAAVERAIPQAKGKKRILYAPTFRGSVGSAAAPKLPDLARMKELLGEEYCLLIKQHPLVKKRPEIAPAAKGFAFDVSDILSTEELICACDVCISDYSSLVFEYSLFERPMIFYAYDLEEYGDWRGFYYDYGEMTPGPVVKTTEEMIEYINGLQESFDAQAVREFKHKFMSACDGHATERILEMLKKWR